MPKILTDFHHQSLLESLRLLFEKRLEYELYRPIGIEWFKEGFWAINNLEDTAKQFLEINSIPSDGTPPLNNEDELSHIITLEEFKNTKFDLILCSIPQHVEPFIKLRDLYQPQAKLIFQVGNSWTFDQVFPIKNIMASAKIPQLGNSFNVIEYHQEMDLNIFHKGEPQPEVRKIYSFVNVIQEKPRDWKYFQVLEQIMPEWQHRSYGGQNKDGNMQGALAFADKIRESTFVEHLKTGGDGFGHTIWATAFCGRPMIFRREDYERKLGEVLMRDGYTGIAVDGKTIEQVKQEIEHFSDPIRYKRLCDNIYKVAITECNYNEEENKIRNFLSILQ